MNWDGRRKQVLGNGPKIVERDEQISSTWAALRISVSICTVHHHYITFSVLEVIFHHSNVHKAEISLSKTSKFAASTSCLGHTHTHTH